MHVHPPKPLHGWREFLNEVLIIVIGILIALALENVVERLHTQEQTRQATEAIKAELQMDALKAWERVAVNGCISGRLRHLAQKLTVEDGVWNADLAPVQSGRQQVTPVVISMPTREFTSEAWKAALANGSYAKFNHELSDNLRDTFELIRQLDEKQVAEDSAASQLSPLGYDQRLTPDGKLQMLQAVAEADRANTFMEMVSEQVIENIAELKLGFDKHEVDADRMEALKLQRTARGACVADPPLALN